MNSIKNGWLWLATPLLILGVYQLSGVLVPTSPDTKSVGVANSNSNIAKYAAASTYNVLSSEITCLDDGTWTQPTLKYSNGDIKGGNTRNVSYCYVTSSNYERGCYDSDTGEDITVWVRGDGSSTDSRECAN